MPFLTRLQRVIGWQSGSPKMRGIKQLISGQVAAQLLAVGVTPIVTRLYAPSDYASMALFSAIVAIAVSVSTGRYDSAIPLPPETPKGERDAITLLALASVIVMTACLVASVALLVLDSVGAAPWQEKLGFWVYFLPPAVAFVAVNQALFQYGNRKREYARMSAITPVSKLVTATLQISLGFAGIGRAGLLIPVIIAPLVGASILFRVFRKGVQSCRFKLVHLRCRRLRATAAEYKEFPLVTTWIALINTLNTTIQVVILASFFTEDDVGQYALAMALVSIPVAVIAGSVSSVYYREMASRRGDVPASLMLTRRTTLGLAGLATPVIVVIGLGAVPLFPVVFGEDWARAGWFTVALLPWAWVRLIGVPLSAALMVNRRQGWQLIWQGALLAGFVGSYGAGSSLGLDAVTCTWISSIVAVPLYLALIPMVNKAIGSQV